MLWQGYFYQICQMSAPILNPLKLNKNDFFPLNIRYDRPRAIFHQGPINFDVQIPDHLYSYELPLKMNQSQVLLF